MELGKKNQERKYVKKNKNCNKIIKYLWEEGRYMLIDSLQKVDRKKFTANDIQTMT